MAAEFQIRRKDREAINVPTDRIRNSETAMGSIG